MVNSISKVAYYIMITGAIYLGLIGIIDLEDNVIDNFFIYPLYKRFLYIIVGLSGLYFLIIKFFKRASSSNDILSKYKQKNSD